MPQKPMDAPFLRHPLSGSRSLFGHGLRTLKLTAGGEAARTEARRMVAEKMEAGLALQALALSGGPGQGILEYCRMRAERRQSPENPERYRVRLLVPPGIGSVQTFSGRHINVIPDGTIEMSADDAQYLSRAGWTKLAECT